MWTILHTLIALPVAFLVNILLARVLGVGDYGRLAFLTSVMDVANLVVSMGVSTALIQFGAKAHARGSREGVRDLLSKAQGFRVLFVAPVLTAIVLLVVDLPTGLLVVAIGFGVLVPAVVRGAPTTLAIQNRTDRGAQLGLAGKLVMQAAVVVTCLTIATPDAVWSVRVVVSGLTAAAALLLIDAGYRRAVLRPRLPRKMPTGFWGFAVPTGLAAVVGNLVTSRSEVLAMTLLSTPYQTRLYALAFGASTHLFAPAQALVNPLQPAVAGLREVDVTAMTRALQRTLRGVSTLMGLLLAAATPTLAILVPVLYGAEFEEAAPMLLVLAPVGGLIVIRGPLNVFLMARLLGRAILWISLAGLAVDVVLLLALLVGGLGAWAAVIAKTGAVLVQVGMTLAVELRDHEGSSLRLLSGLLPFVAGVLSSAVVYGAAVVTDLPTVPTAVVGCACAAALYLALLRGMHSGLDPRDARAVTSSLPARLRPAARWCLVPLTHSRVVDD